MKYFLPIFLTCAFLNSPVKKLEAKEFMNNSLRIHDVTLSAVNVQELAEFYSKIGFGRSPHVNNEKIVVFPMPENDLAIHVAETNSQIGFSFKVKNLEPIIAKLKKEKISFKGPEMLRPTLVGIEVKDPNGNTISFLAKPKTNN